MGKYTSIRATALARYSQEIGHDGGKKWAQYKMCELFHKMVGYTHFQGMVWNIYQRRGKRTQFVPNHAPNRKGLTTMISSHSSAPLSDFSKEHIRLSVHQIIDCDTPQPTEEAIAHALMAVAGAASQADLYEQLRRYDATLRSFSAILSCFATSKAILWQEFSCAVYEAAMFFKMLGVYFIEIRMLED